MVQLWFGSACVMWRVVLCYIWDGWLFVDVDRLMVVGCSWWCVDRIFRVVGHFPKCGLMGIEVEQVNGWRRWRCLLGKCFGSWIVLSSMLWGWLVVVRCLSELVSCFLRNWMRSLHWMGRLR